MLLLRPRLIAVMGLPDHGHGTARSRPNTHRDQEFDCSEPGRAATWLLTVRSRKDGWSLSQGWHRPHKWLVTITDEVGHSHRDDGHWCSWSKPLGFTVTEVADHGHNASQGGCWRSREECWRMTAAHGHTDRFSCSIELGGGNGTKLGAPGSPDRNRRWGSWDSAGTRGELKAPIRSLTIGSPCGLGGRSSRSGPRKAGWPLSSTLCWSANQDSGFKKTFLKEQPSSGLLKLAFFPRRTS